MNYKPYYTDAKKKLLFYTNFFVFSIMMTILLGCCTRHGEYKSKNIDIINESEEKKYEEGKLQYDKEAKKEEYFSLLNEQKFFFKLASDYDNMNSLFELKLENSIPVLYRIDFFENDKIILGKIIYDNKYENTESYYEYSLKFQQGQSTINFIRFYTKNDISGMDVYYRGSFLTSCNSNDINEIISCFRNYDNRMIETLPYIGVYEYENIEIIREYGNSYVEEITPKVYLSEINLSLTKTGNLYGKFIGEEPPDYNPDWFPVKDKSNNGYFERVFYLDSNFVEYNPRIFNSLGDSHMGHYIIYYYFDDEYIIYFSSQSRGFFEGDDGYGAEYRIYYRKK